MPIPEAAWRSALSHEAEWWGNCRNTYAEETKQVAYAQRMGLLLLSEGVYPSWFAPGADSVIDIGGGPVSLLLKTYGLQRADVVDPCPYPDWVYRRYSEVGIGFYKEPAESFQAEVQYDEAWIYNVLEHVWDPEAIVRNALAIASRVRVFEWLDVPDDGVHEHMHPVKLSRFDLDGWLGGKGTVETGLKIIPHTNEVAGTAYYGVFGGGDLT